MDYITPERQAMLARIGQTNWEEWLGTWAGLLLEVGAVAALVWMGLRADAILSVLSSGSP